MPFRVMRRRCAALLAVPVALFAAGGVAVPASAAPGPDFFGINAQPMVKLGFVAPERWGPYLDAMVAGLDSGSGGRFAATEAFSAVYFP